MEQEEIEVVPNPVTTAATNALLASTVFQLVSGGSMSQLWGVINGMQLAAYLPIINVEIPFAAGKFSQ